jgi:hypothetical protein
MSGPSSPSDTIGNITITGLLARFAKAQINDVPDHQRRRGLAVVTSEAFGVGTEASHAIRVSLRRRIEREVTTPPLGRSNHEGTIRCGAYRRVHQPSAAIG